MSISLAAANDVLLSIKGAGQPIAAQMHGARDLVSEAFDSLRPHSGQFAAFEPKDLGRTVPSETRAAAAARIDEAISLNATAGQGIDDAFGSGTWMSDAVTQTNGFLGEARRVLLDPDLGPGSADHAIVLLRGNGFAYDEAADALSKGNVARLADSNFARHVDAADAAAFEKAAHWRTVFD